jgi:hypothetical protein
MRVWYTAFMENFPKRGRPRKIPQPMAADLDVPDSGPLRELFRETLVTSRTHANTFYADTAREVVEALAKQLKELWIPHDPVLVAKQRLGMDWILARKTVLTELGRMMDEDSEEPSQEDIERFQAVVRSVASRHEKLTAKAACAYIRGRRMGETRRRDRVASLHHNINAAINVHHQRFPESTWTDIKKALDLSAGQIEHKLP